MSGADTSLPDFLIIGSPKAGKAVLRCPHCQVTFYERPTCPSCRKAPALNLVNP